jgi:predicted nucleic acid-binding protein
LPPMEVTGPIAKRIGTVPDAELAQLHSLMLKCWDRPMDFADATLVHLANRESLTAILTIDQADFATYRLAGKKRFHVLPIDQP